MLWVVITGIISVLCLLGFINSVKRRNWLAAAFSAAALAVFGFFTVAETLHELGWYTI